MTSIPGSVGYISHVHEAYDYLGPFGVLWVHMAAGLTQKLCLKKSVSETTGKYNFSHIVYV